MKKTLKNKVSTNTISNKGNILLRRKPASSLAGSVATNVVGGGADAVAMLSNPCYDGSIVFPITTQVTAMSKDLSMDINGQGEIYPSIGFSDYNAISGGALVQNSNGVDANTVLYMDFEASLADKSLAPKTIVNTGCAISTTDKKFGSGSVAFNNSAVYMTCADSSLVLGSSNWTFDFWYKSPLTGAQGIIIGKANGTGGGTWSYYIYTMPNGVIGGAVEMASVDYVAASPAGTITANTWNHIAFVRNGGNLYLFVNGRVVAMLTTLGTGSINNLGTFTIGNFIGGNTTYYADGILDEFRFSNIARWTTDFTPPIASYGQNLMPTVWYPQVPGLPIVVEKPSGGIDDNTKLMLHFSDFVDSSKYARTMINSGTTITTSGAKFGSSASFNGTSSYVEMNPAGIFDFGTADFTIDWWEYRLNTGSVLGNKNIDYRGIILGYSGVNAYFSVGSDSTYILGPWPMGNNLQSQWVHRAIVRKSGTLYAFENGTQFNWTTMTGSIGWGTDVATIGAYRNSAGNFFSGLIDEFRVSDIARWTSAFTPPGIEYKLPPEYVNSPVVNKYAYLKAEIGGGIGTSTGLLLHMDGNVNDSSTSSPKSVVANNISYDTTNKKFGTSSVKLTSTDSNVFAYNHADFNLGTGNWTFDWWEYRFGAPTADGCVFTTNPDASSCGLLLGYGTSNVFYLSTDGTTWNLASALAAPMGNMIYSQWVHRAVVRSGSTIYFFENGALYGTNTAVSTSAIPYNGLGWQLGRHRNGAGQYFNGCIDEFRFTKEALWIGPFTPPTRAHTSGIGSYVNEIKLIRKDGYDKSIIADCNHTSIAQYGKYNVIFPTVYRSYLSSTTSFSTGAKVKRVSGITVSQTTGEFNFGLIEAETTFSTLSVGDCFLNSATQTAAPYVTYYKLTSKSPSITAEIYNTRQETDYNSGTKSNLVENIYDYAGSHPISSISGPVSDRYWYEQIGAVSSTYQSLIPPMASSTSSAGTVTAGFAGGEMNGATKQSGYAYEITQDIPPSPTYYIRNAAGTNSSGVTAANAWWQFTFNSTVKLDKIDVTLSRWTNTGTYPANDIYDVYTSTDGTTFTKNSTMTVPITWSAVSGGYSTGTVSYSHTVVGQPSIKAFKLVGLTTNTDTWPSTTYFAIYKLKAYGYVTGKSLGNLNIGDKLKFNFNSAATKWIVADKNHAGFCATNSVTLIPVDSLESRMINDTNITNGTSRYWPNTTLYTYLNSAAFQDKLDTNIKAKLLDTTVSCTVQAGSTGTETYNNVTAKIHLPSMTERNLTAAGSGQSTAGIEGTPLALYTTTYASTESINYWLRTPYAINNTGWADFNYVNTNTTFTYSDCNVNYGIKPMINLPSDTVVSDSTDVEGCYLLSSGATEPVTPTYNYGDGSKNTVLSGYDNVLKVNGQIRWVPSGSGTYGNVTYGNYSGFYWRDTVELSPTSGPLESYIAGGSGVFTPIHTINNATTKWGYVLSGTNNYSCSAVSTESTIAIIADGGGLTTNISLSALKLCIDGSYYTPKQAVTAGLIRPLVLLMGQSWSASYSFKNPMNLYDGGTTDTASFCNMGCIFMLVPGHSFTGFQMYSNVAYSTDYDGYGIYKTDIANFRMTV